jgi:hypothetical protein
MSDDTIARVAASANANFHRSMIEKGYKDPDPSATYIYNNWGDKLVPRGTRVTNVVRDEDGDYVFDAHLDSGVIRRSCTYGWAFVLDTPENADKLKCWLDLERAKEKIDHARKMIWKGIVSLDKDA